MGVMTTKFLGKFVEIVFYIAECLYLSWFAKIFGGLLYFVTKQKYKTWVPHGDSGLFLSTTEKRRNRIILQNKGTFLKSNILNVEKTQKQAHSHKPQTFKHLGNFWRFLLEKCLKKSWSLLNFHLLTIQ